MSSSVFIDGDPDGDASRPRSGILTPTSDASLNRHDALPSSSAARHKAREDGAAMDQLLKSSISVKPHPHDLHVQPRTLLPLLLLPRQHLPLGCIDFDTSKSTDFPPSRFYESHVKILDLESRMGSTQSVLVARSDSTGIMYALERQRTGLYVVCKLGPWVELEQLARRATAICRSRVFPPKPESKPEEEVTAFITPQIHKEQKRKRAAIEAIQSLVRKRAKPQPVSGAEATSSAINSPDTSLGDVTTNVQSTSPNDAQNATVAQLPTQPDVTVTGTPSMSQPADNEDVATGIFDNIRAQYFEALYKSKGSLAYFAKGPLSRARSAFHLDLESTLDMAELIDFLKSLILTTVQIDKKYRESAPAILCQMGKTVDSSDEGQRKRRKVKKMKLGKDGLYPRENETIQKWWATNKPELREDQTKYSSSQMNSHLSLLRTRETQLQMILILEILALEPLKTTEETQESEPLLPGEEDTKAAMAPPPKKRNKHNLPVLVDVHADRLTIWQSTATDELLLLEDTQATLVSADGQTQQKSSSEPLKDFCVDVIVPFFSARLPQLCDAINRKLGGPVIVSPPKARTKRSSSKRDQKPGAATKRPTPLNAQRNLQRALSVDQNHRRSVSRGPSNMIALMRSATSTAVPGLKREGSEPAALRSIPKADSDPSKSKLSSLSRSSSFAGLDETKAKKKALVEAQLKDAISGLRKPNRDVVGRALEEAAEQRVATGIAKKKKGSRISGGPSIQVKATPVNNRFKDVFSTKAEREAAETPLPSQEDVIPPSSIGTRIPSTSSRAGYRNAIVQSTSPAAPDLVGSTPTKPTSASFLRRTNDDGPFVPPSPLFRKGTQASPAVQRSSGDHLAVPAPGHIFATPAKKAAPRRLALDESPLRPNNNAAQSMEGNKSIYQQLGWDDDLDDL